MCPRVVALLLCGPDGTLTTDSKQEPEMLRVPLQQLCLQVKVLNLASEGSIADFLEKVLCVCVLW